MAAPTLNPGDGRTAVLHNHLAVGPFLITCKSYRSSFERTWHQHAAASLDFIIAGAGTTRLRRGELEAGAGDLCYCPAECPQSHRAGGAGMMCMHVAFLPEELQGRPRPRGAAGKLESPAAAGLAVSILREVSDPDISTALEVESLARELLRCAAEGGAPPVASATLEAARDMLQQTLDTPVGLHALADHCGISRGRLAAGFRAAFGMTPGQYHRRVRLMEAIRRLARSDEPVARIAVATGFTDQAHMTRIMRAECGETPARLRRLLRGRTRDWSGRP